MDNLMFKMLELTHIHTELGAIVDNRFLCDRQALSEILVDYVESDILETLQRLRVARLITNGVVGTSESFVLSDNGRAAYFREKERRELELLETAASKERQMLSDEKLKVDLENAKRVLKSYPLTKAIAWSSFISVIFLLLLKLAEVLKIWPYHK